MKAKRCCCRCAFRSWRYSAALPFAFCAALLLARTRFFGKTLVDGLIHVPLVLPPVAIGFLLLIVLGTRHGPGRLAVSDLRHPLRVLVDGRGVGVGDHHVPVPGARRIRLSLESIDPGLGAAAETLGARWWDRLMNITLPLALPGVAAGDHHGLRRQPGRVPGAIITFVSNIPGETRTLPLAIYDRARRRLWPAEVEAARLSAMSIVLALIFMTACRRSCKTPRAGTRMSVDVFLRHDFPGFALDISFALPKPGVTALFGVSGAGKTTIVNAIAGMFLPRRGPGS